MNDGQGWQWVLVNLQSPLGPNLTLITLTALVCYLQRYSICYLVLLHGGDQL